MPNARFQSSATLKDGPSFALSLGSVTFAS